MGSFPHDICKASCLSGAGEALLQWEFHNGVPMRNSQMPEYIIDAILESKDAVARLTESHIVLIALARKAAGIKEPATRVEVELMLEARATLNATAREEVGK